ncbi:toprim domain-containing protein [Sphingomonas sp. 2R-10]|uniref:DUF7146 domain-containing protein n=1 Tax=Sphingomonas sp. 2R-10 TaxID=3045148 RepID=UPI000F78F879|nr:toprim domain-containing protein [Sphingomonas sp. 2R-10]MDJ0277700.1 toprim domain-containing protein [Sphingomonas sp. 2R-10]
MIIENAGADLIRRLGGTWRGDRGMCLCPAHADVQPSLSVRVGHTRLLFHCFAGCDTRDVLRAIARIRPEALDRSSSAVPSTIDDRVAEWRRLRISDLWDDAGHIEDTIAGRYLARRAIDIASPSLRFQPLTPLGTGRAFRLRPAMLAAVTDGPRLIALQRTFLDRFGCRARDLTNPRRSWGRPAGGTVRLAAANDDLALGEGVESGLSAMILLGLPVWAVLGSQRMAQVTIPDTVRRLILLPDNDLPGRRGAAAAAIAHAQPGRTIETLWPWYGLNDWNDVLRARRRGGVDGLRHAA